MRVSRCGTTAWQDYFTEMCSGSEAGSYVRLIAFVHHSTLGLRVMKKTKNGAGLVRPFYKAFTYMLAMLVSILNNALFSLAVSERSWINSKGFKDFYLQAKARIWR